MVLFAWMRGVAGEKNHSTNVLLYMLCFAFTGNAEVHVHTIICKCLPIVTVHFT